MKQFFINLLASILGGIVLLLLFIFLLFGLAASSEDKSEVSMKDNSYLSIDLNGRPIADKVTDNPFSAFSEALGETTPISLNDIIQNIEKASNDSRIKGILLQPGVFIGGAASAREINEALKSFKAKGKKVYSYGTFFSSRGLYLASVSDSIFLDPSGMVDWTGMNLGVTYYKGMLDKIGVKAEAIRGSNNKFKSAVEPFIQSEMSESNRLQLETLANDLWTDMLVTISEGRKIPTQKLQNWADSLSIIDSDEVLNRGLCDALFYKDQWQDFKEKKLNLEKESDRHVRLSEYKRVLPENSKGFQRDKIAVLFAQGEFTSGTDGTTVDADVMVNALQDIRNDDKVKALVIRVNSPGGQAWIADKMVREIELIRENIPVVISMGNLAASAGYMISAVGDSIFTQSNTITGSIGVFGLMFHAEELLEDKMGLKTFHINTASHSDLGSLDRPLDDFERRTLQKAIDRYYSHFVDLVASNRNLDPSYIDSIGQGRVWSGQRAIELGLADALGGLIEAKEAARKMAGLDSGAYRISEYPVAKDPIEELLEALSKTQSKMPDFIESTPIEAGLDFFQKWKALESKPLMRMESDIIVE